MKIIRCENDGWPFNCEKHEACPRCGEKWKINTKNGNTMSLWSMNEDVGINKKQKAELFDKRERKLPYLIESINIENEDRVFIDALVFTIGRALSSNLMLEDNLNISRNHAVIKKQDQGFYLIDLDSVNGTFLNGKELDANKKYKLNNEDIITFYNLSYVFKNDN